MNRLALLLAALPALASCSDGGDQPVDAVTPAEAQALDDAAAMLEERRLPPEALEADGADTGETNEGETEQ
ncbi:hypothetical protein [Qipengyuania zhejiangensis]|uniref:hypothetical protein n=1 Tax=Qipengyuania zhejiangensis TaxID=3077782 RepID=UPI002D78F1B7|nr:hypothetical protein [Qipengyuania sp. Z2]